MKMVALISSLPQKEKEYSKPQPVYIHQKYDNFRLAMRSASEALFEEGGLYDKLNSELADLSQTLARAYEGKAQESINLSLDALSRNIPYCESQMKRSLENHETVLFSGIDTMNRILAHNGTLTKPDANEIRYILTRDYLRVSKDVEKYLGIPLSQMRDLTTNLSKYHSKRVQKIYKKLNKYMQDFITMADSIENEIDKELKSSTKEIAQKN